MTNDTMKAWEIVQQTSGETLGVYQAETAELAIRAMLRDAGAPDAEPDPGLRAVEVE